MQFFSFYKSVCNYCKWAYPMAGVPPNLNGVEMCYWFLLVVFFCWFLLSRVWTIEPCAWGYVTEESCPCGGFSWWIMCIGICGWRMQSMEMCNGRILTMGKYSWRVLCNGVCSWGILSMGMFNGRISLIVFLLFARECITEEVCLLLNVLSIHDAVILIKMML